MKIIQGDLSNASKTVKSGLKNVTASSKSVEEQINTFAADSLNVLVGKGFDYVRNKLFLYLAAFTKLSTINQMLSENIVSANNNMANETQGLDLDTKDLDELKQTVARIKTLISWYSTMVVVDDTVPDEEKKYKMRNQKMKDYYEEILSVIEEKVDLLERLPQIAEAAASLLGPITTDAGKFASNVEGISVSNISV